MNTMEKESFPFCNIGELGIKDVRKNKCVQTSENGAISEYVPFYFAGRSPMLYRVSDGGKKQEDFVYIISFVSMILKSSAKFAFTDGHPTVAFSRFYNDINDIERVDFDVMKLIHWRDTAEDLDIKRRRQAEFLVKEFFSLELCRGFAVINENMQREMHLQLSNSKWKQPVHVRPQFYF